MITQIIINEDKDIHISNNYGDIEPFNSALKTQMFYPVYQTVNGLDNRLISKRLLRNHIRKYWNNLPYLTIMAREPVNTYLFECFNNHKNIF